jgi:Domain of unknown function (DUF4209)
MPLPDITLSQDDFIQSKWEDVISGCREKVCREYSQLFWKKSQEAEVDGALNNQAVFTLLTVITDPELNSESYDKPFTYMDVINSISDGHLNALRGWATEISDAELRARVTDVLWMRKRHPKNDFYMAQIAVKSYLESAQNLEHPEHWTLCFERLERAIRLARKINHQFLDIVAHIESVLDKYNGEDPLFLSAKLMKLLQEYQQGDFSKYAAIAEKAAIRAEAEHNWHKARSYWEVKTRWHLLDKDTDKERTAWMSLAETYVKEAEDAVKQTPPSHLAASSHLQKAIEAFRKTKGTKEETKVARERGEILHQTLLTYQKESLKEMAYFSESVDVSKGVELARDYVKKPTVQSAIFALALIGDSPKVDYLRQKVEELARDYPLQALFPGVLMNEMGKVTGRQPSMLSRDPKEVEEATRFHMYKYAIFYQQLHADAVVKPAKYQINLDHNVRIDDFLGIVFNSPFVPPGREYIYAQGLHAGLTGDFLVAAHILIPQIENSIRYLLIKQDVITSGLDAQGIQDERSLNTTLYLPETINILTEDITFDLQGLLVERSGSNLRNRMAHGLIDQNGFFQPEVVYLWWLTLRLCCLPIIAQNHDSQAASSATSEGSEGDAERA